MASLSLITVVALGISMCLAARPQQKPVLAIMTSPMVDCGTPPSNVSGPMGCIFDPYVKWAESAGIRVVPLRWDLPTSEHKRMMTKVNGVLFAGGSLDDHNSTLQQYYAKVVAIVNKAKQYNDMGSPFVIWGTCQGMQLLSAVFAENKLAVIENNVHGLLPKMLPLDFTSAAASSRIFSPDFASASLLDDLQKNPVTLNYHHEGVSPQAFLKPGLGTFFTVVSTNKDVNGLEFVSTMEGKFGLPFYGVQWHPEWPMYDWSNSGMSHDRNTIRASEYMGQFLRSQLMLNNHSFESADEMEAYAIERHPYVYSGWGRGNFWIGAQWNQPAPGSSSANCNVWIVCMTALLILGHLGGIFLGRAHAMRQTKRSALLSKAVVEDGNVQSGY